MDVAAAAAVETCAACGTEIAVGVLACPGCQRLVHATELVRLKAEAERAAAAGDRAAEIAAWTNAIVLLPAAARQHAAIADRLAELARLQADQKTPAPEIPRAVRGDGSAGWAPSARWRGSSSSSRWRRSARASSSSSGSPRPARSSRCSSPFGVYWTVWGWKFALGFVLSIYVHEMGHVAALSRFGVAATAPMFIPGFGALIRLKQHPRTHRKTRASASPGRSGARAARWLLAVLCTGDGPLYWAARRAHRRVVNLFNLMPVWQLDGVAGSPRSRQRRGGSSPPDLPWHGC